MQECSLYYFLRIKVSNKDMAQTNLAIVDCVKPLEFTKKCVTTSDGAHNCGVTDTVRYKTYLQPILKNPETIQTSSINDYIGIKYDKSFYPVKGCSTNFSPEGKSYICDDDARLISGARGTITQLDRPPLTGSVSLKDIYSPELINYGQNYRDYSDIHSGQILYYIDRKNLGPYDYPNYTITSKVDAELFQDPMGAIKPRYPRSPIAQSYNAISKDSRSRDTVAFRESIMASQSAKRNQQRYDSRWYN